jgi:hypothetical protein
MISKLCKSCNNIFRESSSIEENSECEYCKEEEQECDIAIVKLKYSESAAFEATATLLDIEVEYSHYDESTGMNVYNVKFKKGESGFLFDIARLVLSKVHKSQS